MTLELPTTARASVALPNSTSEVRTLAVGEPADDTGWLRVLRSGICGTDVSLYARGVAEPVVLGHHVVAEVAAIGSTAAARRGLRQGDRVVLEEYLPCGTCPNCTSGTYRLCPETDIWRGGRRVGTVPVAEPPGLHGGNAEYVHLPANAVVHRLPHELDDDLAAWVLPYANALDWTLEHGRLVAGETVVVLGPGYHGLAVAAAALASGAGDVVVTGLPRDHERLEIAEALGARVALSGESLTLGETGADLVVDTTGADPAVLKTALPLLGHGGRLLLTTPKQPAAIALDSALLLRRNLSVGAVRGRAPEAVRSAVDALAAGLTGLERVPSVDVGLDDLGSLLGRLAGGRGPATPHVVVHP